MPWDPALLTRFCAGLHGLLRETSTPEQAGAAVRAGLARREELFSAQVQTILARPGSPYSRLFRHAGVEQGDVDALLRDRGLEGALGTLYDAGIYTTSAELKGETPIRRGSLELTARPVEFENPAVSGQYVARSGGSGGPPRSSTSNLSSTEHAALYVALVLSALELGRRPAALWYPSPPGAAGLGVGLQHLKAGWPLERWFAQTPWLQAGLVESSATTIAAFTVSRLRRRPLPFPRHTPAANAVRVARWAASHVGRGSPPYIACTPSSAVRVATAAEDHGLDIARTFFRCAGESLTPARVTAIRARGADARAFYFASEATGLIAAPCAHGEDADDAHVAEDKLGVIARERPLPDGGVVSALLLTALAPWARKLVVNWESGDTAVLERRACGCPLGTLGLTAHVRRIRSYEKLTSEGMSFQDAALVALVEDILPAAFGGRPNDYQIVEEETPEGTRVRLRVSPRVGAVDESAVAERAFRFLAGQGGRERAMTAVWRDAGTLEVVRVEPHVTDASKTLPLYRFR